MAGSLAFKPFVWRGSIYCCDGQMHRYDEENDMWKHLATVKPRKDMGIATHPRTPLMVYLDDPINTISSTQIKRPGATTFSTVLQYFLPLIGKAS